MAKRPSRFRSLLAAVLIAGSPAPAFAQAPVQAYAVIIDGAPAGPAQAYFNGAHTMVSLENIAARLHLRLTKRGTTRLLHVGEDAYAFAPGQTVVTENGQLVMQTTGPPEERNRMLFITIDDLESLLSQSFTVSGARIAVATAAAAQNVHAAPLAHPRVSQYTVRSDSGSGGGGSRPAGPTRRTTADPSNALVIHAALEDYNGFRSRDLSFTTEGARLRGSLDVSAFENSAPGVAGGIAIGTHDRYLQIGSEGNPLNGLVFNAPGGNGAGSYQTGSAVTIERDSLGRTLVVARRDRDNGATFYGAIRTGGTIVPFAGERATQDGVVKITREFWLSSRGAAASIGVATQGRLFGEAVLSQGIGNFPLTVGEAPDRLDAGLRIGDLVTLRAGVASGYAVHASPYVGLSFFGVHGTNGSIQITGSGRNATLSYAGPHGSIAGTLTSSAEGSSWGVSGTFAAHRHMLDVSAFRSGDNEDDIVRLHGGSAGMIAGIERIVSGGRARLGPVFGLSLPVGHTTAFEITEHPIAGGRALGFGFTQRIAFDPRVRMRALQLQNAAPGDLYIDDRLVRRVDSGTSLTAIAPGIHHLQLRSFDGTRASITQTVDDTTTRADVALLSVRPIAGRVVQTDADPAGRKISLEHLQVRLDPGDLIVETEADGSFVFPPSPVADGARVSIVRESLPDELSLGDDAPASALSLHLDVRTKIKVHHKKF